MVVARFMSLKDGVSEREASLRTVIACTHQWYARYCTNGLARGGCRSVTRPLPADRILFSCRARHAFGRWSHRQSVHAPALAGRAPPEAIECEYQRTSPWQACCRQRSKRSLALAYRRCTRYRPCSAAIALIDVAPCADRPGARERDPAICARGVIASRTLIGRSSRGDVRFIPVFRGLPALGVGIPGPPATRGATHSVMKAAGITGRARPSSRCAAASHGPPLRATPAAGRREQRRLAGVQTGRLTKRL